MKLSAEQFSNTLAALGSANSGQSNDQRGAVRIPMGTKATIIPCSEKGRREVLTVVVLNLSETGVGVLNAAAMRSGDTFILRLPASGTGPAGAVLCSVIHSHSISYGMYAIGAQFERVISVQASEPQFIPGTSEPAAQDLDHVREVECRLNQLSM